MSFSIIQPSTSSDTLGSYGAVVPGTPDNTITFPNATGVASLGPTMISSGIITMSALSNGSGSGSATVSGLTATDVVLTSIDTDASGSSFFYTKVDTSAETISFRGLTVSGSTYAKCHYVVYRTI